MTADNPAPSPARPDIPPSATDAADRAAIARCAAGELHALEELYDRYRTMAYSIALRMTGDSGMAEDVVQDAFLGAWRNAGRYIDGAGDREDVAPVDRPPPGGRRDPTPPADRRAAGCRGAAAVGADPAGHLA